MLGLLDQTKTCRYWQVFVFVSLTLGDKHVHLATTEREDGLIIGEDGQNHLLHPGVVFFGERVAAILQGRGEWIADDGLELVGASRA